MSKMDVNLKGLTVSKKFAVAYPFPMHLAQRFTYHLSILQFAHALSEYVPVYLLVLDKQVCLEQMFREEFGIDMPSTLIIVSLKNTRLGFKSNTLWFRAGVNSVLKRLSSEYSKVIVYSRNVKIFNYLVRTKLKRNLNITYAFESHQLFSQNLGFNCEFDRAKQEHQLETSLYPQTDHVFANTPLLALQIKKLFSVNATVLPVAVREDDLLKANVAPHIDFQSRHYDFAYVGSFDKWKGVETLVSALDLLKKNNWTGRAVLVGIRKHEVSKWNEIICQFELSKHVDLVERVPRRSVFKYIDNAKFGVVPNSMLDDSIFNTSPLKLFDYAARGLPIVVSRVPAIDAGVSPPVTLWCRPDDPKSLSEALCKALQKHKCLSFGNCEWASEHTWRLRAKTVLAKILS